MSLDANTNNNINNNNSSSGSREASNNNDMNDEWSWREWAPLSPLLDQLPQQFQRGLSASDLCLTCVAALPDHLILGTNVGLVYLAHLPSLNLMRLKCENPVPGVSCVAGVRTVDDMVASGSTDGTITIFQLPRVNPCTPGNVPMALQPTVKRFSVGSIHGSRVTALSWSLNGMMLFSGDEAGVVGLVEVNYQTSECTARMVLAEPSPVAQLSYVHQRLAVCTHERALIYALASGTLTQVGHRPRKISGSFGCVWCPDAPKNQGLLYTSRPGLRLWAAEGSGKVLHTHIITDLPAQAETRLLNPSCERPREGDQFSLGLLHLISPACLVSHNSHWLFIFNAQTSRLLSYTGRFRRICSLAVCGRDIFVLEGSRTISCLSPRALNLGQARISYTPRIPGLKDLGNQIVTRGSDLMDQLAKVGSSVAARVSEHTSPSIVTGQDYRHRGGGGVEGGGEGGGGPLQGKLAQSIASLIPSLQPPPAPVTPDQSPKGVITGAYEEVVSVAQVIDREKADCGPLVTRDRTKKKKGRKRGTTPSPDTLSLSGGMDSSSGTQPSPPEHQESGEIGSSPTPSSEDLRTDIQEKEVFLAGILDIDCLKRDHMESTETSDEPLPGRGILEHLVAPPRWNIEREESLESTECSTPSTLKEASPVPGTPGGTDDFYARVYQRDLSLTSVESGDCSLTLPGGREEDGHYRNQEEDEDPYGSLRNQDKGAYSSHRNLEDEGHQRSRRKQDEEEEEEGDVERLPSNLSEDRSSCLSYGPPSGSSLTPLPSNNPPTIANPRGPQGNVVTMNDSSEVAEISWSYLQGDIGAGDIEEEEEQEEEVLSGGWVRHSLPGQAISLATSDTTYGLVDTLGHLYFGVVHPNVQWKKVNLSQKVSHVSLSPSGAVWVVGVGGAAYSLSPTPKTSLTPAKLVQVARDVHWASVGDANTWYISRDMQVCVCTTSNDSSPIPVPSGGVQLVQVVTRGGVVWGLTKDGQLVFRVGVGGCPNIGGQAWGTMATPCSHVAGMALGPERRGWIVDGRGQIYFRTGVCQDFPQGSDLCWWEVVSSRYMVGEVVCVGEVLLAASSSGIMLAERGCQTCYLHGPSHTGHRWDVISEEVWSSMCAEGLYRDQGVLCFLSPLGQLFLTNPNTRTCVPLEVPGEEDSTVVSVSQRPEVLWVLTSAGRIYIRAGLSASSLLGTHWEELDLSQIGDIQLSHISCGTDMVWGVDSKGDVYMRLGLLTPPQSLPPAWIQVEHTPSTKGTSTVFTKVFVGVRLHLVWAIDACRRVYVRQAIYPELRFGLSWVLVPGLMAVHLTISEDKVFALTPGGEVFHRLGVSAENFIGDAWERVPGMMSTLSVSTDNVLWGLNTSGHLCQHMSLEETQNAPQDTPPFQSLHTLSACSEISDWEIV